MQQKIDIPSFAKEQLKKHSISPDSLKPRLLHRRFTSSQLESNLLTQKKHKNNHSNQGLQQLLKTSPYTKLVSHKSHSQIVNQQQDSFTYQLSQTPMMQTQQQNFFKSQLRQAQSNNSTMSSSVKPRMRSANKDILFKKSVETTQVLSNREKEMNALQAILVRSQNVLHSYKSEIDRLTKENQELIRYIHKMHIQQHSAQI